MYVRFYEWERILREPPRNASGYRSYGQSDLEDNRTRAVHKKTRVRLVFEKAAELFAMMILL